MNWVSTVGFALLMLLMLAVMASDILKLQRQPVIKMDIHHQRNGYLLFDLSHRLGGFHISGGQIFFMGVDGAYTAVTKKKLDPKYMNWVSTVGFALLMLLIGWGYWSWTGW